MTKYLLASAAAFLVAAPAAAQDFTGPRAEVRGGFDRIELKTTYDDGVDRESVKAHKDGVAYGAEVGYDALVSDNVVIGGYAGVDFASTKACGELFGEDRLCLKAGRNFTLGLRAGAPVAKSLLFYVKGGYSNGRLKTTYVDYEGILDNFSDAVNRDGLHAGAGLEYSSAKGVYGKVEYVYTNYKGERYSDEDFSLSLDGRRHQVLAGVGFRF